MQVYETSFPTKATLTRDTLQNIKLRLVLLSHCFFMICQPEKLDCTGGAPKALSTLTEQYSTGHEQYVILSNMHNSEQSNFIA